MTRLLVGGTDQVQLPVDSSGKRAGFIKTAIGGAGTEIYIPANVLTDDAGNTLDSAAASLTAAGTERGLVVRPAGITHVRGASLTGQTLGVTAATPVTGTGLDASAAGNVTFTIKNTVAATAFTGTPVIVFEQSDDNVSWGPLPVVRADTGAVGSTQTFAAGTASGEVMCDAGLEGVNWVRVRVTTAQSANGMTVVTSLGGMPFSPSVTLSGVTMKAASTAAVATDPALVVAISPNNALFLNQNSPVAGVANSWPVRPSDGTNFVTVKAASTMPTYADTSEVVTINPGPPRFRAATFRTPGIAGTVGQKLLSIHNATGSTKIVRVRNISVSLTYTVVKAITVLPPTIRIWKVTVLPTNGTAMTKVPFDSAAAASNASITVLQGASADGTSSGTALTATLPSGTWVEQAHAPRMLNAGTAASDWSEPAIQMNFLQGTDIVLNALEGIVVFIDYTTATFNPITDMWTGSVEWSEA